MFCNVLCAEKKKIRDLISDLPVWKSDGLFILPVHVLASNAFCTVQNKQLKANSDFFQLALFLLNTVLLQYNNNKKKGFHLVMTSIF